MKAVLYLITGFLGAGKTTFLREFIGIFGGKSIRIIVNEFGKTGVDGKLIESDQISGGSIFCSCRIGQFENALDRVLDKPPDIIIVETSGLSDPTAIRKILDKYDNINYGGCICIADAVTLPKVYATARVCKKQLSVSDAVLLNKTDIATPEQISVSREIIKLHSPDVKITETSYGRIPDNSDNWIDSLRVSGEKPGVNFHTADINLHSMNVKINADITLNELTHFIGMIAEDTYRIKGFVTACGIVYFVDCVGASVKITPYNDPITADNALTVLYGYGLQARKSVLTAAEWYPEKVLEIN